MYFKCNLKKHKSTIWFDHFVKRRRSKVFILVHSLFSYYTGKIYIRSFFATSVYINYSNINLHRSPLWWGQRSFK